MNTLTQKLGARLAQFPFVREAIDQRADLSGLRDRRRLRIVCGVLLIALSFAACWPVIGLLGTMSIYYRQPLVVAILGPIVYGITHCCFLAGMALAGERYVRILLRWAARVSVEKMMGETRMTKPESPNQTRMTNDQMGKDCVTCASSFSHSSFGH
jgi:hypothetical protein